MHYTLLLLILINLLACSNRDSGKKISNNETYDFNNPKVINLPVELDEISGIAYYAKDTSIFAIIDEDGILFKVPLLNPARYRQWRFDKRRDYEDIVMIDSTLYVLVSNGDIETVTFNGKNFNGSSSDFGKGKKSKNEFEILYQHPDSNALVMVCKDCEADAKTSVGRFNFDYSNTKEYTPDNAFDMSRFAQKIGQEKHLKASAAAINPITKDLYMVSSVHKVMLVIDPKGNVKEVHKLKPDIYKQPEGMAFTPAGDLIISNEFADDGLPNLLIIKNNKKTDLQNKKQINE